MVTHEKNIFFSKLFSKRQNWTFLKMSKIEIQKILLKFFSFLYNILKLLKEGYYIVYFYGIIFTIFLIIFCQYYGFIFYLVIFIIIHKFSNRDSNA
jgi:hypothetical protein